MYTPDELVKLAVQKIIAGINTGESPQTATTKVAEELNLNHNFIKRASEAVNVALHHNHFKSNPDNKAGDFPTVDAQKVAEDIYGVKEKTAAELQSERFSSFQYPETTPKFARYLEEGPYKKAFEEISSASEISKFATSEKGVYEKATAYLSKLKKIAYEKEAEAIEAEHQIEKNFCDILRKFAQDNYTRSSWDQFETAVYSKYGDGSKGYLDLLYKTAKLNEERGEQNKNIKLASACPELAMYDKFVASIDTFNLSKTAADEATHNYNFENDYLKDSFAKRGCELTKNSYAELDASLLDKVEQSIKEERSKIASVVESEDPVLAAIAEKRAAVLTEFDGRIKSAIDLIDMATGAGSKAYSEVGKPSLSASSNTPDSNRERALLLQELVTTDPIISKFPTHHTVDAYQQLLRIAPELSKEKEISRAFLRQAGASQAIDPFQAEQLIKANTQLFKQHQLQHGIPTSPDAK
jgi:hypothetical protein